MAEPLIADLHTPEELLSLAEELLATSRPDVRRAVVLEAFTALEAFVHRTVFGLLRSKLDPLLVRWLDDKTKYRFDDRLGVLAPVALGQPLDKKSRLWTDYQKARELRNKVTHAGKKVSLNDATFVLETVRAWLAYLGSTGDVALALDGLKAHIESRRDFVASEQSVLTAVRDYFRLSRVATPAATLPPHLSGDFVLKFGERNVVVDVKLVPAMRDFERRIREIVEHTAVRLQGTAVMLEGVSHHRYALVILTPASVPEAYEHVRHFEAGSISVVAIHVRSVTRNAGQA